MFAGELYSTLSCCGWLRAHALSKVEGRVETCILEEWTKLAEEQGTRSGRTADRGGKALQMLGKDFPAT